MKKIIEFIKRLFKSFKNLVNKFVEPSILVVEALKKAVESPVTSIIVNIIPSNLDNEIILKLKKVLPEVLKVLKISDECIKYESLDEIVSCVVSKLKTYTEDGRAVQYHNIASLLSVYLSDKKISWKEAVHLAEYTFQNKFKKNA